MDDKAIFKVSNLPKRLWTVKEKINNDKDLLELSDNGEVKNCILWQETTSRLIASEKAAALILSCYNKNKIGFWLNFFEIDRADYVMFEEQISLWDRAKDADVLVVDNVFIGNKISEKETRMLTDLIISRFNAMKPTVIVIYGNDLESGFKKIFGNIGQFIIYNFTVKKVEL